MNEADRARRNAEADEVFWDFSWQNLEDYPVIRPSAVVRVDEEDQFDLPDPRDLQVDEEYLTPGRDKPASNYTRRRVNRNFGVGQEIVPLRPVLGHLAHLVWTSLHVHRNGANLGYTVHGTRTGVHVMGTPAPVHRVDVSMFVEDNENNRIQVRTWVHANYGANHTINWRIVAPNLVARRI